MLWYGAYNYVVIIYGCSVFSYWLCFLHSSDFPMQERSSVQLNTHQSTVHRKVHIWCCVRMNCLAARAIKPISFAYCHEHMWCGSSSLGDFSSSMCMQFWHHGVSLLAPSHLRSPLEVGFFPYCLIFLGLLLPLVPHGCMMIQQTGIFKLFKVPWSPCNVSISFGTFSFTLGLLWYRLSSVLWNKNKRNITTSLVKGNVEKFLDTRALGNLLYIIRRRSWSTY